MISEKQRDLFYSMNKENFLLPRINGHKEAHTYNVQMQVRQLEHEAYARFSQRQREQLSRFSQEANQTVVNQRELLVTEVTSGVRRRDEQVYDLRTELSFQALHSEDVTQQQSQ